MNQPSLKPQHGAALIVVLLIVALATVIASNLAATQQIDIRRTANIVHWEQSLRYNLAVETWAVQILVRDAEDPETAGIDHLDENWATSVGTIPVEGGQITGKINDLQARFNLNNLVANGVTDPDAVAHFQRLLRILEIDDALAWKLADWIDEDFEVSLNGGAEDGDYLGLETPYRTPNAPLKSISELRLVQGFTPEIYRKLAPHVCALPGNTRININTASATLIQSLSEHFTDLDAQALIELRTEAPFSQSTASAEIAKILVDKPQNQVAPYTVNSHYFVVTSQALFGEGYSKLNSIILRGNNGGAKAITRSLGNIE